MATALRFAFFAAALILIASPTVFSSIAATHLSCPGALGSCLAAAQNGTCSQTIDCTVAFLNCTLSASSKVDFSLLSLLCRDDELNDFPTAGYCVQRTCAIFKSNNNFVSCSAPYRMHECNSSIPPTVNGAFRITGNFSVITSNATTKKILAIAIKADLSTVLGFNVTMVEFEEDSTVLFSFQIPTQFTVDVVAPRATWFNRSSVVFLLLGGTGTFTVIPVDTFEDANGNTRSSSTTYWFLPVLLLVFLALS